jgi:hypothetical protein
LERFRFFSRRRSRRRLCLVRAVRLARSARRSEQLFGGLPRQDDSHEAEGLPRGALRRAATGAVSTDCRKDVSRARYLHGNREEKGGTALNRSIAPPDAAPRHSTTRRRPSTAHRVPILPFAARRNGPRFPAVVCGPAAWRDTRRIRRRGTSADPSSWRWRSGR